MGAATASTARTKTVSANDDSLLNLQERFYRPVEVAYILGIQQSTVQSLCREGKIEALKPGKSWLIAADEIRRYLKEGPRKDERTDQPHPGS